MCSITMPELIDVPLADLDMGEEYSVIFPIGDMHEAYDAEFVEDNTQEYLFEIVRVYAGPKEVGDNFSVRNDEQTFDIADRIGKYLILTEEIIHFPDDLADAHVDTSVDAEIGAIFAQGDNNVTSDGRMRLLNRLLMRSRSPTRSPLSRHSPRIFSRSHTPLNGGRRRRHRTRRKRTTRRRPNRRRTAATRRRTRRRRHRARR